MADLPGLSLEVGMDTIPWMISMSSPSPPASGTEKHHELGWDGEMGKWVGLMLVNVTNAPKKNPWKLGIWFLRWFHPKFWMV